jgi:hypothetical protein
MTTLDKLLLAELADLKPDQLYGTAQTRSIHKKDAPYVLYMIGAIVLVLLLLL